MMGKITLLIRFINIFLLVLVSSSLRAEQKNVQIGTIYNLTGGQASIDFPSFQGFNLAFEKLKDSKNPYLSNLHNHFTDGKTDEKFISQEAIRLYQIADLIAVIGISDDDMARSVAREARRAKKIFITSGATSPLLTQEFPTYTFLVAFGNNTQAAAIAEYARQTAKLDSCYIMHDQDMDYARYIMGYFSQSFSEGGGIVLAREGFSNKDMDLSNHIKKIKELKPEMIYLAAGPDHVKAIVEKIRSEGIKIPIFGGDSFDTPLFPNDASDIFYATHVFLDRSSKDQKVVEFMKAYREKYGVDPNTSFAALGYDACNLFAEVLSHSASTHSDDLLKSLNTIQFQGVTGDISYDEETHTPKKAVSIISSNKGKKTEVARFVPSNVPPAQQEKNSELKKNE